ncbi:G5 domain-containing protein [Fundicoccus ignavus]|uniref:G5 domain-containing protein n=1 Tax=Fundicoccus ignavus TaxID=2664442 RepID=UPI00345A5082
MKGYREERDPTKFSQELNHYSLGVNGKLTRKYLITIVDGLEKKRELINLEVNPSKPEVVKMGIRGGNMNYGGK